MRARVLVGSLGIGYKIVQIQGTRASKTVVVDLNVVVGRTHVGWPLSDVLIISRGEKRRAALRKWLVLRSRMLDRIWQHQTMKQQTALGSKPLW